MAPARVVLVERTNSSYQLPLARLVPRLVTVMFRVRYCPATGWPVQPTLTGERSGRFWARLWMQISNVAPVTNNNNFDKQFPIDSPSDEITHDMRIYLNLLRCCFAHW